MGLILDSSVLIAGERRGETVRQVVLRAQATHDNQQGAVSAVSIVELTHGIYRAQTAAHRERRREFVEELCRDLLVQPVTSEVAQLAGRIKGQQAAKGIIIAFEDPVIGATAMYLGFGVAILNVRHCQHIPELSVVTL